MTVGLKFHLKISIIRLIDPPYKLESNKKLLRIIVDLFVKKKRFQNIFTMFQPYQMTNRFDFLCLL